MSASNLWRYPAFSTVAHTPIFLPTIVLLYKSNGLSTFDVFLLQGLFAAAVVFLEVPTGMLADQLGKRTSLLAAMVLNALGFAYLAIADSFTMFFISELILAVGMSLFSGADSALLYDTLKDLGREDEYKRREGQAKSWQMVSFAVSNLIGGLVGAYSYRGAVWLSVTGPILGFIIAWGFVEVRQQETQRQSLREALQQYQLLLRQSMRFVSKHQLVRWNILFFSVLAGSSMWLLWLYQPYMKQSGMPVWTFGIAFAIFNLFAAFASHHAHAFEHRLGTRGSYIGLGVLQIVPLLFMSIWMTPLSFLFILGHQAVRGIARPVISDQILQYTFADKRATVLSINSLVSRLFFAITAPLVGWVANNNAMSTSLLGQAALLVLLLAVLWLFYRRIPDKYFAVKASVTAQQ